MGKLHKTWKPGTMYSLIKIHKENNPDRVITSLH